VEGAVRVRLLGGFAVEADGVETTIASFERRSGVEFYRRCGLVVERTVDGTMARRRGCVGHSELKRARRSVQDLASSYDAQAEKVCEHLTLRLIL
jgi:hypothetical protein